uniref:Uncharacterized protein n=1 Tax=Trichuris muris TaxID=70415 RepID=A0A5S6QH88_TRIMR
MTAVVDNLVFSPDAHLQLNRGIVRQGKFHNGPTAGSGADGQHDDAEASGHRRNGHHPPAQQHPVIAVPVEDRQSVHATKEIYPAQLHLPIPWETVNKGTRKKGAKRVPQFRARANHLGRSNVGLN